MRISNDDGFLARCRRPEMDSLRLQVIDYDEAGNLTLGGKGKAKALLRALGESRLWFF